MADLVERAPRRAGPERDPADRGRRRRWPLVLLALLLVVAAWAAVVAVLGLRARDDLEQARAAGERATAAVFAADVTRAAVDFSEARAAFDRAASRLGNPLVRPARVLPVVGPNLRAVTGMAETGSLVAQAGARATGAVADLPGGVDALVPSGGGLPLDALTAVGPPLTEARGLLEQARACLDATPGDGLVGQVAEARAMLDEQLGEATGQLARVEPLVRALPAFLGADGPRRYFFGAAQPAELRGSTGFIGAFAILELDQGRFSFSSFRPIDELPLAPPGTVEPPNPDFLSRYGDFGGTGVWHNLNVSPDFPTTGRAIERLWEHTFGERLDGTISADPFALAALLRVAGPTEVPGIGMVDADTVVPFVAHDAYGAIPDAEQRKRLLGDVAASALAGFLDSGLDRSGSALDALRALGDAVGAGHVLVHAADETVQAAFESAGIAGTLLDPPGDYFAAVLNGASGSKIDYYLERELDYTVTLEPEGEVRATATLRLHNTAPTSGEPAYVIGPNNPRVVAGDNELYVGAYLAAGAQVSSVLIDGAPARGELEQELGHPVIETFEHLPSGAARELRYEVVTPDGWTLSEDGGRYRLTLQQQATIRPTRVAVEVRLPEGMTVVAADEPWTVEGDVVSFAGEPRGTFSAEVVFAPPRPEQTTLERLRGWLREPIFTIRGS